MLFRSTLQTIAHETHLSMGFPRQEYWSRLPFPSPGDLHDQGWILGLLHWQVDSLPLHHNGKKIHLPMKETQEMQVRFLGWEDPLEVETATFSNILAWEIPWTEEPGGLQSMGSQKSWTIQQLNNKHLSPLPTHDHQLGHSCSI